MQTSSLFDSRQDETSFRCYFILRSQRWVRGTSLMPKIIKKIVNQVSMRILLQLVMLGSIFTLNPTQRLAKRSLQPPLQSVAVALTQQTQHVLSFTDTWAITFRKWTQQSPQLIFHVEISMS